MRATFFHVAFACDLAHRWSPTNAMGITPSGGPSRRHPGEPSPGSVTLRWRTWMCLSPPRQAVRWCRSAADCSTARSCPEPSNAAHARMVTESRKAIAGPSMRDRPPRHPKGLKSRHEQSFGHRGDRPTPTQQAIFARAGREISDRSIAEPVRHALCEAARNVSANSAPCGGKQAQPAESAVSGRSGRWAWRCRPACLRRRVR
jgi:hypothetical protein